MMKIKEIKKGQCPACGSQKLESFDFNFSKGATHITQEILCENCDFLFEDWYELTFVGQKESGIKTYLEVGQEVECEID